MSIRGLLDLAGAKIGGGEEWELAKYALVSWIDEVLLEAPWEGREWWSDNVLEMDQFNSRLCNELFFTKAQEAASLPQRDALEVFYVCVVLGFRGLYRDPELASGVTHSRNLPPDLETWVRQASLAIRLAQGRPPLADVGAIGEGAPPLQGQSLMIWTVLTGILFAALGCAFVFAWAFLT